MPDTYPPADDRLTHLIAQELNPLVDSWKQAMWLATAVVDSPAVRNEMHRVAAAHLAGEDCGDKRCARCTPVPTTDAPKETRDA